MSPPVVPRPSPLRYALGSLLSKRTACSSSRRRRPRRLRAFSTYDSAGNITGRRTWYDVLGVPRSASRLDIRQAYLDLVQKHHPDRIEQAARQEFAVDDENVPVAEPITAEEKMRQQTAKFSELVEAYDCLGNHEKRRAYDHYLKTGIAADRPMSREETAEIWKQQYKYWEMHKEAEARSRGERPLFHQEMWNWKWWVNWDQGMPLVGPVLIIIIFGIGSYYQSCVIMSRNPDYAREIQNAKKRDLTKSDDEAKDLAEFSVAKELRKARPYRAAELDEKEKARQVNREKDSVAYNLVYEESVEGFAKQSDAIHVVRNPRDREATRKSIGYPERIHILSDIPWVEDEIFTRAKREWWNERRPTYKSEPIYLSEDGKPTTFVIWFSSIPDMKGRAGWFLTSKKFLKRPAGRYPLAFSTDNYAADPARIRGGWYVWDAKNQKFKTSTKVGIAKIEELDVARVEAAEQEFGGTRELTEGAARTEARLTDPPEDVGKDLPRQEVK